MSLSGIPEESGGIPMRCFRIPEDLRRIPMTRFGIPEGPRRIPVTCCGFREDLRRIPMTRVGTPMTFRRIPVTCSRIPEGARGTRCIPGARPHHGRCVPSSRARAWRPRQRCAGRARLPPGYYGAFVRDPDGNNIEAVYHAPAKRSAESVTFTF
jgi:hypothetical protein